MYKECKHFVHIHLVNKISLRYLKPKDCQAFSSWRDGPLIPSPYYCHANPQTSNNKLEKVSSVARH